MRLVCGDNNSFQQTEYNLKIANHLDLVTCSHSDCSLARSWEPAGISRELGFFQVSSYLSCCEIQIGKRGKRKKRKLKEEEEGRKKERKKRGKEEERKTRKDFLSFIFAKFHAR